MQILKYRFAIHSTNPDKLAKFYTDILGFKQVVHVNRNDEYGFGIEATPGYKLWIAKHSEIKEQSKDPFRILISFYVDDIEAYFSKITEYNKNLIIEPPTLYCQDIKGETRKVCAFLDPDGNCVQMMQIL